MLTALPALLKARPPRTVRPLNPRRTSLRKIRANLTRTAYDFLRNHGDKIIGQIMVLRSLHGVNADAVIDGINFSHWISWVMVASPVIADASLDGAFAGLDQISNSKARKMREAKERHRNRNWQFPKSNEDVVNELQSTALAYGRERAASMVGMRIDALGRLVPNPDAAWQITETTRNMLRADIREAIAEGWSNDTLAAKIADSYGFSKARAMMIARTETNMASNRGALESYKASGVVHAKEWLTARDGDVTPDCALNEEAGPIALDATFPSGASAPPDHPNCRCTLLPGVDWTKLDNLPSALTENQS